MNILLQSLYENTVNQLIRHIRWQKKKKALSLQQPSTSATPNPPPAAKRFKVCVPPTEGKDLLPPEQHEKYLAEMQKEWEKDNGRNEEHLKTLFLETFTNRRKWMEDLDTGKIFPIITKYPVMDTGKWVGALNTHYTKGRVISRRN